MRKIFKYWWIPIGLAFWQQVWGTGIDWAISGFIDQISPNVEKLFSVMGVARLDPWAIGLALVGLFMFVAPYVFRIFKQRAYRQKSDFSGAGVPDDGQDVCTTRFGGSPPRSNEPCGVESLNFEPWIGFDAYTGRPKPNPKMDLIIIVYGQSLANGTVDTEFYATSSPNHPEAVLPGRAVMPNGKAGAHVMPVQTTWTDYVDLKEGKHPTNTNTVETMHSGMAQRIFAELDATFTAEKMGDFRTVHISQAQGGKSIRRFDAGSNNFQIIMDNVRIACEASRADDKVPIVGAIIFSQGEADRSKRTPMTATQRAREITKLQKNMEAQLQKITGQASPIPMIHSPIQRANTVNQVIEGALMAADSSPGSVFVGVPNYALEYNPTGTHPSVDGHHRTGDQNGKLLIDMVWGKSFRHPRIVDWYKDSATELVLETELPEGGTLTLDTSGDLIDMTSLAPSYGFHFRDKNGLVTISNVLVKSPNITITFAAPPDWDSLTGTCGHEATGIGDATGGIAGPRIPIHANDGSAVAGLVSPGHSYLLPAKISLRH